MKARKTLTIIFEILVPILYLAAGAVIFVMGFLYEENYTPQLLGALLIAGSACRLYKFLVNREFFDVHTIDLSFSLISIAIGFVFFFKEDIEQICLIWGLLEILNGGIELGTDLREIREKPLLWISILISLGEIVFGTLLCIHGEHGIFVHLLYMASTFLLTAVMVIVELYARYRRKGKKVEETKQDE